MYKSPIEIMLTEMQVKMENGIMKAVRDVGVNVDATELLKALAYDREQYKKGYADGREAGNEWISVKDRLPDNKEHDWVLAQVVEDNGFMHIPKVMEYRQQKNDWYEETYGWISEHDGAFTVTHWMPLPEPPKEE